MQSIKPDPKSLRQWPSIRDTPGYVVLSGEPVARGRLDVGNFDSTVRAGIWACSEGSFECTEIGDELQTILKGRLHITETDGTTHEFVAGDSFFTNKGARLIWNIIEAVEKIFFTYNCDGKD